LSSKRTYIAIILSLFLHIILIYFINQNKSQNYLKNDLFANKILLNFSLTEEISKKIIKNQIEEKINQKKDITAQKQILKKDNISQNIVKKDKIIPNIADYQLLGKKIMPNYPRRSLKLGQEGVIHLKILVSDQGLPEEVIFTQKSQYKLLNDAALEAVLQWKFQPMIINGKKSQMWVNVPIEFKIG